MRYKLFYILVISILVPIHINSQDNNPIDKELTECMDKNPSTQGIIECVDNAYNKWDSELNIYYKKLMDILDENGKTTLKEVQRKWIEFRDLEFKNIEEIYSLKEGTMYLTMSAIDKMDIVKKRTLDLKDYYDLLTEK